LEWNFLTKLGVVGREEGDPPESPIGLIPELGPLFSQAIILAQLSPQQLSPSQLKLKIRTVKSEFPAFWPNSNMDEYR
jgi:hypothetical protein